MAYYLKKINTINNLIKNLKQDIKGNPGKLLLEILNEKIQLLEIESQKAHTLSERKLVTILFADISGFTALSEVMDPEQVKSLLNNCFDALVPIIEKHGGYIDKFIGDEIMALFGAPIATENAPESSLMAALEMLKALEEFNQNKNIKLEMHIGINTGLAVTGGLGAKGKLHYTVIGDAVNLASRLESLAQNGQILIGEESYLKTQHDFDFKVLDKINVKGKKELVQPYQLLGKKIKNGFINNFDLKTDKFYGRKRELNILKSFFERTEVQRQTAVMGISGEAGIGKSELLFQFLNQQKSAINSIYLKALSFQRTHNYALVIDLALTLLELPDKWDGDYLKLQLKKKLPKLNELSISESYIYLAMVFNIKLNKQEQSYIENQNTELAKSIIEKSIFLLLEQYCEAKKLLLIIEDIRWLDASSFSLLKFLINQKFPNKIGIIVTDRSPELLKTCIAGELMKDIVQLGPLDNSSSKRIIRNNLKIAHTEINIEEMLLKNANGNPLYLKEIAFNYSNSKNNKLAFYDSFRKTSTNLQSLLAAKLDQLPTTLKEIVQVAAVIGNEFSELFLFKLMRAKDLNAEKFSGAINQLIDKRIFQKNGAGKLQFRSNVYADVAYQNLLKIKRRMHHGNYATLLIQESKNKSYSAEIAKHLELSSQPKMAIPYLEEAINQSLKIGSNIEANNLTQRLLLVLSKEAKLSVPEKVANQSSFYKYCELHADINVKLGNIDYAVAAYKELIEWSEKNEYIFKAHLHTQIALAYKNVRKGLPIKTNALEALKYLNKVKIKSNEKWAKVRIEATLQLVWGYYFSHEQDNLYKIVEGENAFVEKNGSHAQKADWYFALVAATLVKQNYYNLPQNTIKIMEKGLKEAIYSKDKMLMALKYCETGFALTWTKKPHQAIEYFLPSIQIASHCYYNEPWITSLNYLGYLYRKNRNITNLEKYVKQAYAQAIKTKNPYLCTILGSLLSLQILKNQDKMAKQTNEQIEVHKKSFPPHYPIKFMWEGPQFSYAIKTNNYSKAAECITICLAQGQKVWPSKFTSLMQKAIKNWEKNQLENFKISCIFILKENQSQALGFC